VSDLLVCVSCTQVYHSFNVERNNTLIHCAQMYSKLSTLYSFMYESQGQASCCKHYYYQQCSCVSPPSSSHATLCCHNTLRCAVCNRGKFSLTRQEVRECYTEISHEDAEERWNDEYR
jgi:hypothetical protein